MARKLRIAVSVFFGLLTVALCMLWGRSYWAKDYLTFVDGKTGVVTKWGSNDGCLIFVKLSEIEPPRDIRVAALYRSLRPAGWSFESGPSYNRPRMFSHQVSKSQILLSMPHWLPAAVAAIGCAAAWANYRFSLRTLLIATTLVAAVLGLAVWAVR